MAMGKTCGTGCMSRIIAMRLKKFEGRSDETYLIDSHNEKTTIEIRPIMGNEKGVTSYQQLIEFAQDRSGRDPLCERATSYKKNLVDKQ